MWDKGGKVIKVPFAVGSGNEVCVLEAFRKWSKVGPFRSWNKDDLLHHASL